MPYWNPSKELRRKAEAKALAVSLYQPEGVTNRFIVEAPQKIFAHLLTYLPTPDELVRWTSDPTEIDRRVKGAEYWMLIDPKAPQQRTGVLGSLNMSADSFRLLPKQDETTTVWTATKWADTARLDLHHLASERFARRVDRSSAIGEPITVQGDLAALLPDRFSGLGLGLRGSGIFETTGFAAPESVITSLAGFGAHRPQPPGRSHRSSGRFQI
jgi:hypothetical protein